MSNIPLPGPFAAFEVYELMQLLFALERQIAFEENLTRQQVLRGLLDEVAQALLFMMEARDDHD